MEKVSDTFQQEPAAGKYHSAILLSLVDAGNQINNIMHWSVCADLIEGIAM